MNVPAGFTKLAWECFCTLRLLWSKKTEQVKTGQPNPQISLSPALCVAHALALGKSVTPMHLQHSFQNFSNKFRPRTRARTNLGTTKKGPNWGCVIPRCSFHPTFRAESPKPIFGDFNDFLPRFSSTFHPFLSIFCHVQSVSVNLSGPLRLRVQSRSRMRLRITASIAFLFRACFKGV